MPNDELRVLLNRCKLNPLDDTPRFELANWLKQNGDRERGEFLELQVQFASNDKASYPGGTKDEPAYCRILKRNVGRWIKGHFDRYWIQIGDSSQFELDAMPTGKFERGTFSLSASSTKDVPDALSRFPADALDWLETLELDFLETNGTLQAREADALKFFTSFGFSCNAGPLPNLAWLNDSGVRRLHIGDESSGPTLEALSRFSALRPHRLQVSPDPKHLSGWRSLMESPVLEQLRALESGIDSQSTAIDMLARADAAGYLENLYLMGNPFPENTLRNLFDSPVTANLTELSLVGYSDQLCGVVSALARSQSIRRLHSLDLGFNTVETDELVCLAHCPVIENLRSLSFSSGSVTDKGMQALAESQGLHQLESLDLSCAGEGDKGAIAIVKSPNMTNLRRLSLCRCEITDRTVQALGSSRYLGGIEELDLSLNAFQHTALDALASSDQLRNLRYLRAEGLVIDIGTFRRLLSSPVIEKLEGLAISSPSFGPQHVKALVDSPKLGSLKKLLFSAPGLRQGEINALVDAPWIANIVDLNLIDCGLDDIGIQKLVQRSCNSLTFLQLEKNLITRHGATALFDWPGLNNLCDIGLYNNPFPDDLRETIYSLARGRPIRRRPNRFARMLSWFKELFSSR